jgi:hypothetical protein
MNGRILRAVYNRPEMLYLSMEYEIKSRKRLNTDNYSTLFALEFNADPKCVELINDYYPFEKTIVMRPFRHFGWGNILEGFKQVFFEGADYVLNIEDDCLLHETYFTYMATALSLLKDSNFSVINASRRLVPNTNINAIQATNLFEAPACLMDNYFFTKYVRPYATYDYYANREAIIHLINKRNGNDKRSKYRPERKNLFQHIGWDGLVNRLIDTAFIEEGLRSYSPACDRQIHIGFYGQNRIGKLPFKQELFMDRVEALREVALNATKMMRLDPHYKDYVDFALQLDNWSGELTLI